MPRITNQIHSDGLRNRRSGEQDSGIGSFQLGDCFTGNVEELCKINWDDVDEFNAEKEKNREFSEIKINSDEYLAFLKKDSSMSDAKFHQLIELVDKDSLKGTLQNQKQVLGLHDNHKRLKYLNKVGQVSYALMWKNMLGNMFEGDVKGVAVDLGFIVADSGLAKAGEAAVENGAKLALKGDRLLGQSFKLASPFLARGTSAFVVYDLYKKIKAYQQGNPDAKIEIVRDGAILGLDGLELGIELFELTELLEGVSSFTGPIGALTGAVIFIGVDIYVAVKQVNREDALIHLTAQERFVKGVKYFFEIEPDQHIKSLLKEKGAHNKLFTQELSFLKNNTLIQRIIRPTLYEAGEVCDSTIIEKDVFGGVGVGMQHKVIEEKKCAPKFEVNLDNIIRLDQKKNDIKWSAAKPDATGGGSLFCAPLGNDVEIPSDGAYVCDRAMGIEYSDGRTGNVTLMKLGDGEDKVIGFPQGDHLISLGNGTKDIRLGDGNDTFILHGHQTSGILDGGNGINTLELSHFAKDAKFISIEAPSRSTGEIPFFWRNEILRTLYNDVFNRIDGLLLHRINNFLLRADKRDFISAACNTHYIDARGGEKHAGGHDTIAIPNDDCPYALKVMARPYTRIVNQSENKNSKFSYIVPVSTEEGNKFTLVELKGSGGLHQFISDYSLSDVFSLRRTSSSKIEFAFLKDDKSLLLEITLLASLVSENNLSFILSDNISINVVGNHFYAFQTTNRSVEEIVDEYSKHAERLNISIFSKSQLTNESIAIGHGNYEILHNNPDYRSHLVGNGGENVFVITSGYEVLDKNKLPTIPEVVLYDKDNENLIDTLDLRPLRNQFANDLGLEVKVKTSMDGSDILLEVFSPTVGGNLASIRLNNALVTNWHKRLHILLNHAAMELNSLELKPLPLEFASHIDQIHITSEDVEENTTLVIAKNAGNYRFLRARDNLIISNGFHLHVTTDQRYTLLLHDYFKTPKLETLSIRFNDKKIVLKDAATNIAQAREFSQYLKQYSRMLRNKAFNQNVAKEVNSQTRAGRSHHELVDGKEDCQNAQGLNRLDMPYPLLGLGAAAMFVGGSVVGIGAIVVGGLTIRKMINRAPTRASVLPMTVTQAAVVSPLLSAQIVETKAMNQEVALANLDKDRAAQMDGCVLGARYGDELVAGFTCHTTNGQMAVFLKDSDVKLTKPEIKLFKESCRPVEFNGRPSLHCEGEESNIVYTPEVFEPPLERINGLLMLFQVGLHEGRKFYNWLQSSGSEKISEKLSKVVPITTEQKTIWAELLVDIKVLLDIETHIHDVHDVKDKLRWVWHILEDRKEEYKSLSQKSQASLEDVTAMTENLKALQAELEEIMNSDSTFNSDDRQNGIQTEKVSKNLTPGAINISLLSHSANQLIGFTSRIRQSFFGERHQLPSATSLDVHAMNSTMINASAIQQQCIGGR